MPRKQGTLLRNQGNLPGRRDDWGTPLRVFEPLDREFAFTLDVCASDYNHKVARYFTEADNGLQQSWANERCWLNPPYKSTEIAKWLAKAYMESQRNGATVVALVPALPETGWWHDYVESYDIATGERVLICSEYRFIKGRVPFVPPPGRVVKHNSPNFGSAIVVYRPPAEDESFYCDQEIPFDEIPF